MCIRDRVSIGTVVTLREATSGKEETYTVLGAWDSDPDQGIISYQTAIGQALLGRQAGETVTLSIDQGTGEFTIVSITAAPVDVMRVESAVADTATVAAEPVGVG